MHGVEFVQDLAVVLVVGATMGWLCQRIGLSVVVGFLLAGIIVGPSTPPLALVTDPARIETLAQIGLVFLMFSIGLRLSLRKLRRLGWSLLFAVFCSSIGIYYLTRLLGAAVGWSGRESLFVAAMLMVSSSAIIGRVLQSTGTSHERRGQLAMGVTALEDIVAVVMLTLLGTLGPLSGEAAGPAFGHTVGLFGAFVVLAGIALILLVPWLLRRLSVLAGEELQTLGMAGMLFVLAMLAQKAGFSLALGAFLLGTVMAETPHRHQIERTFEGTRDVFSAIFFIAIGMQIDVRLLGSTWMLILGVALFTIVARTLACTVGLTLIGTPAREALRTGLTLTPIGEFSFIIAQLGIIMGMLPREFYSLAVGVSLLTSLASPMLTRHSKPISRRLIGTQPRWLRDWLRYYQDWLEYLSIRSQRNRLWQLSKKRFLQIAVGVLLVTGLWGFSEQWYAQLERWLGRDWPFPGGLEVIYWLVLTLAVLAPLVALWRNISALALLYAQVSAHGHPKEALLRRLTENAIKIASGAMMYVWLSSILPAGGATKWVLMASAVLAVVALLVLRRKLVYWHSAMEAELQEAFTHPGGSSTTTTVPWLRSHGAWNLSVSDCVLPDLADCIGKTVADLALRSRFGCSIVGIERQGVMIPLPSPQEVLYPLDKVLLMGTAVQVAAGKAFLRTVSGETSLNAEFEDIRMEAVAVPADSWTLNRSFKELSIAQQHSIHVSGITRGGLRILSPGGNEVVREGDQLLVLGTPEKIAQFKRWLQEGRIEDEEEGDHPESRG